MSFAPRRRFPGIQTRLLHHYRNLPSPDLTATHLIQSAGNDTDISVVDDHDGLQGVALLRERSWDSQHFGFSVGALEILESFAKGHKQNREIKSLLLEHLGPRLARFRYVTCRLRAEDLAGANALEAASFEYLIGMVTLQAEGEKPLAKVPAGLQIRAFRQDELTDLVEIARSTFTEDRFHRDPGLTCLESDRLHGEWIRNCCVNGLADVVLVCCSNKKTLGFVACRLEPAAKPKRTGEIVLLGVAPGAQGRGIGSSLVRAALIWFGGKAQKVVVRTEATNYPSLRTYQKEHFRPISSSNYFRKWI